MSHQSDVLAASPVDSGQRDAIPQLEQFISLANQRQWQMLADHLRKLELSNATDLDPNDIVFLSSLARTELPAAWSGSLGVILPSRTLLESLAESVPVAERLVALATKLPKTASACKLAFLKLASDIAPRAVAPRLALAWTSYDLHQIDQAIRFATEACTLATGSPNNLAALGWFLLEDGQLKESETVLLAAIACQPDFAVAFWYLGLLRKKQQQLDAAKHALLRALQLDPGLDEAAVALAWVLHDMGSLVEATLWARKALAQKRHPDREELLGLLLLLQSRYADAAALLGAAVTSLPHRASLRCHLAIALQALKREDEAVDLVQKGLALSPSDPELLLSLGWLHYQRREVEPAKFIAQQLVHAHPEMAKAWHLLGVIWHEGGHSEQAESCFAKVQALDESLIDALLRRATLLREMARTEEAVAVLRTALACSPDNRLILTALARGLIDAGKLDEARRHIHYLLRQSHHDGQLWLLLALVLLKKKRPKSAQRMLRRALGLTPENPEIWRMTGWIALEQGDLALARKAVEQTIKLTPNDPDNDIQAAFVLEAAGDLTAASRHAENAVVKLPKKAEAWRALAKVRHRQYRLHDAESLLRTARAIQPDSIDIDRQLAWVLMADHRFEEAEAEFQRAARKNGENPTVWLELAQVRHRAGHWVEALEALQKASNLSPDWSVAALLKARILVDAGPDQASEAISVCSQLLRKRQEIHGVTLLLMRLAASGHAMALAALKMVDRQEKERLYGEALESAQGTRANRLLRQIAALAVADFPDDMALATAAFFANGLDEDNTADDMACHARLWSRQFFLKVGCHPVVPMPARQDQKKMRVAYVAAHFHRSLLARVLAAHDPGKVEVFLYTDAPLNDLGQLGAHIAIQVLSGQNLAVSMAANRIEVAVDTVGNHPFLGQLEVLKQFAMRIAPVQCAWLGSWAGSAGVFDILIADQVSLPLSHDSFYEEAVTRLPGGQWCWEPPAVSPEPGEPPCLKTGTVTFGSSVRGLRLTRRTLQAWAKLLSRIPHAGLELIGEHGLDWQFQSEFSATLAAHGVSAQRVRYRAQCNYKDYLAFYNTIDVALDAFPFNGGLCLIDALWMGVPLVTQAGTLLGERQGISLLAAVGHLEWASYSDEEYVEIAFNLATRTDTLIELRHALRQQVLMSALVDGQRVARALEQAYFQYRTDAREIADAGSAKERSRALARQQFLVWCAKQTRLDFSGGRATSDRIPDVSVVIVLFNQAGLSRLTLSALADQTSVSFETIVIDNASTDATGELLDRLDGAYIERNVKNFGFLLAANQGAAKARGRHILFLNSDAILQAGALFYAVKKLDAQADVGVVGGRIVLGSGKLQEAGCIAYRDGSTMGYGRGQEPSSAKFHFERDVDFCSGAFLMVRRTLWQQLGGFDTAFAPAYYEDTDFCLRVWDAGYRVVYEPRAWINHFEWASATSSDEVLALMAGNQQRFASRHQNRLASRPLAVFARPENDRWLAHLSPRILVIDNAVPHMALGGGLPRARSLLHALHGYAVTFYPLWTANEDWREVYTSIPASIEVMLGHGAHRLESFLEERTGIYDVIFVSRPPNMAFVDALWDRRPELFKGMRLIYDAEAVFALREIGQAAILGRPLSPAEAHRRLATELVLAKKATTVLTVSRQEADCFSRAGFGDVRVLMHSMETRAQVPAWQARQGFLFVGAIYPDTPNEDSLLWLAREVLPRLKERWPDMPALDIVGDCQSAKVAALACQDIRLLGRIDDLTPCYDRARVFIAPTRFAAGVPAKVIEAACNGLPVVATQLLVGQLGWHPDTEILSASDANGFADAMICLYQDEELWVKVQNGARFRTRAEAAPEQFERILRDALAASSVIGLEHEHA